VSTPARQATATANEGIAAYWPVPLSRAIVAIAVGAVVTFIADHGPHIGLFALGVIALGGGLVIASLSRARIADRTAARVLTAQGVLSAVIGIAAIALGFTTAGIGTLLLVATLFAALTGVLELYAGLRTRSTTMGRDWLTVGGGTMLFAIVLLLIPADTILTVGLIGAYGVVVGVYLVIAALSLRWSTTARPSTEHYARNDAATEPSTGATS
jgi:hypothetical protein